MASSKIRGITIEIGGETTKLGKALEESEKSSKSLQSELKGVNTLLKMDPSNVELLKQKQELLTKSVEATESKLGILKNTMSQIKSGEIEVTEEQFRDLQREIINTENKLDGLKKETKNFGSVSKQQLKETAQEFQDLGNKAGELGNKLALGLAGAATGAIASVEATREFRQDLGKLETTFDTTNHGAEVATNTFKTLYGVLGEEDTAIEAANHLALMTDNEQELEEWTNILTGVYATFGDSLPLEGLAEAANETARVGQVTGPLADALNWLGVSEDEFNEKLAKTNSEQERNALIRDTLNGLYGEASNKYKEVNAGVIEGNQAQADMNLKLAEISSNLEPLITKLKVLVAEVLEKLTPIITWIIDNISILAPIVLGFLGTLFALNIAAKVMNFIPIVKTLFATLSANPIGLIITVIGLLVTAFITLWNNCESFRNFWIGLWEKIKSAFNVAVSAIKTGIENIKKFFSNLKDNIKNIIESIKNFFVSGFNTIKEKVVNSVKSLRDGAVNIITNLKDGAVNKITSLRDGIVSRFNSIKDTATSIFNKVKTAITSPIETASNVVKKVVEKIKGFFNFKVSLPKIKLPHFSISPKGWELGDLLKGVKPKLGIEWYAKAMKNPRILDKPTAFGISPDGNIRAGGEAGPEMIGGVNTVMSMISSAVGRNNKALEQKVDRLTNVISFYMPEIIDNMGYDISLDGKKVGKILAPAIDTELGILANQRRRGR